MYGVGTIQIIENLRAYSMLLPAAVLSYASAYVGTSLEFKDEDTAKEFARMCKPMIVKYLFGRDDHENFKFDF